MLRLCEAHWAKESYFVVNVPSMVNDPIVSSNGAESLRGPVLSPSSIIALMRANYEMDVWHILPTIAIPTLVMHRTADARVPVSAGRYLAEHIPGAKYAEIPGTDDTVTDSR